MVSATQITFDVVEMNCNTAPSPNEGPTHLMRWPVLMWLISSNNFFVKWTAQTTSFPKLMTQFDPAHSLYVR